MIKEPKRRTTRKVTKKVEELPINLSHGIQPKIETNGTQVVPTLSEDEYDNSTIRCPCGDNTDKGLMIQCETCLVWQHSICVGIREDKAVPAHYFCEICLPRNFKCTCGENTATGKFVECNECSTWQHVRCLNRPPTFAKTYRCPNCAPQDFLQSATKLTKRKETKKMPPISKSFSFVTSDSLRELFEKDHTEVFTAKENFEKVDELLPSKQEVMEKYCIKFCDANEENKMDCYELLKGISILFDCSIDHVKEWFEEILQELTERVKSIEASTNSTEGWTQLTENEYKLPNIDSIEPEDFGISSWGDGVKDALNIFQIDKSWGFEVTQPVLADQFIIEYLGTVVVLKDNDYNNLPMNERFHILRTSILFKDSPICVDARTNGNKSRFIRRSCLPNATVKYLDFGKRIHAGIFAKNDISANTEITIDFDVNWRESKHPLECCCKTDNCEINTWFKHRQARASSVLSDMKAISFSSDTDESEEEVRRKKRKKTITLSPPSSDKTKFNDEEVSEAPQTPTEKMSREDRKIAMLMKSFQKMENRQNKKRRPDYEKRGKKIFPKRKKAHYSNGSSSPNDYDDSYSEGERSSKEEEKIVIKSEKEVKRDVERVENGKFSLPKSRSEEKISTPPINSNPEIPTEPNQDQPSHSSPNRSSSHKFGKKAWILEFQAKETTTTDQKPEEVVSKFPVKKKMLGSFYTDNKSESGDAEKKEQVEDHKSVISEYDNKDSVTNSPQISNQIPDQQTNSVHLSPSINSDFGKQEEKEQTGNQQFVLKQKDNEDDKTSGRAENLDLSTHGSFLNSYSGPSPDNKEPHSGSPIQQQQQQLDMDNDMDIDDEELQNNIIFVSQQTTFSSGTTFSNQNGSTTPYNQRYPPPPVTTQSKTFQSNPYPQTNISRPQYPYEATK